MNLIGQHHHLLHRQQSQRIFSNNNFMGKSPFTNPNPNPNHNKFNNIQHNSSSRKQISHPIHNGTVEEFMPCDATSFSADFAGVSFSHYVTFDISAYSKADLRNLKSQLMSELDKIRNLSSRIGSKKRPSPFPPSNGHNNPKRFAGNKKQQPQQPQPPPQQPPYTASATVMKMCATVLRKLSNQKAGMWFTSPVDVIGMGLHDYHTVIDRPMDLGTIKDKLDKGGYDTPEEFAVDVRLTFNNALRYNPKGHEVNTFAGQYLALFERWFPPILAKFHAEKQVFLAEKQLHFQQMSKIEEDVVVVDDEVKGGFSSNFPSPKPEIKPISPPMPPVSAPVPEPVQVPASERSGGRGRRPEGKLPKPKAKEPNKREMSMEEKHKLGAGLQSLPEEKMAQVIQIIRKRNGDLSQDGDEIELDIEAVDTETLWELDRLVTNYKKMVSKIKRQGLICPESNNVGHSNDTNQVGMSDKMVEMTSKAKKGGDVGEEDVDIGDEMPVNNFPPVEIDKDDDREKGGGGGSSSSSSSSGSDDSSSSDSDSGSSSGSDSDVDDAHSLDNESKNFHH